MAKMRIINTKFWDDNYIANLDPVEKLMFLYFLTNPATNICGFYELPLKNIALDTGIDKEMVQKILERFTADGRIFFIDGWICIKNFIKHQNQRSPKIQRGIKHELSLIPAKIIKIAKGYGYRIHTLSHSNSNLNLNSNLNSNPNRERARARTRASTPSQEIKTFFISDNEDLIQHLIGKGLSENLVRDEIKKFIAYWTEKNKSGKKQRWELQKTFEIKNRLASWFSKIKEFNLQKKSIWNL